MTKSVLVGDIGSTKSSWWFHSDRDHEIHLAGYHPLFHSITSGDALFQELAGYMKGISIDTIWYYGAGVIDSAIANDIRNRLLKLFSNSEVQVDSDIMGAVKAACGDQEGTVAILGTGSHAAVFDGHGIIRQANSLGYILGDEGGGCDIGKAMLQGYFYNEMPSQLSVEMEKRLPSGRTGFLKDLLASPAPNQYLAAFAEVAVAWKEDLWIKELVRHRFTLFVKRHILPLAPQGPVHIVGSIGCIFAGLIQQELEDKGLVTGQWIKNPSRRLFEIHMEHGGFKK
jgi:hypothetical protein